MKKFYEKPVLVRRESLVKIAAVTVIIVSGGTST